LGSAGKPRRVLLLATYAFVFVWFNNEPWRGSLPLMIAGPPRTFLSGQDLLRSVTRGFPLIYWTGATFESRFWPFVANVVVGFAAWCGIYFTIGLGRTSHRLSQ